MVRPAGRAEGSVKLAGAAVLTLVERKAEFVLGFAKCADQRAGRGDGGVIERNFDHDVGPEKMQPRDFWARAKCSFERDGVEGELRRVLLGARGDGVGLVIDHMEFTAFFEPEIDGAASDHAVDFNYEGPFARHAGRGGDAFAEVALVKYFGQLAGFFGIFRWRAGRHEDFVNGRAYARCG